MPAPRLSLNQHMQRANTVPDRASTAATRKFQRSLSLAVREGVDPMWFVHWNMLIMQGKTPVLVEDQRCASGYRVVHDLTRATPTLDEQNKAIKYLSERGWGQPVQQLLLDAELRGQIASFQADLDLKAISGALTLDQRDAMLRILQLGDGTSSGARSPSNVKELTDEAFVDVEDQHAGVIDVASAEG